MAPRAKAAISGLLRILWVSLFVVSVILAFGWFVLDGSTTRSRVVRSRLTIVVETPEGERSGSSVTQNTISFPGALTKAQGWALTEQLVGEVVAVDLGERGVLFSTFERPSVLSRRGGDAYNASLAPFPQEKFRGNYVSNASLNEKYAAYLDELNRLKPKSALLPEAMPALVRFVNLNDPTSVALLDPHDLAASFGRGVILKGATIEITDDPITHGIEDRLPWLRSSKVAEYLFPNPTHQPPPDAREVRHLSYDDFRRLPR
ncbi:hypothetical protein [Bradyrhizobium sp. UNPF46]|uniref:hypothetical protein n=1 Tax=Bradyrhizobium sp. UNPF46 TaxID=1141168 RepID=UPI0011524167|nr:hypothetical protein [Bradyrhizobium sp. UNPF46]